MTAADPNAALAQVLGIPKPSLRERFARWLGFSFPPFPYMDDLDRDVRYTAGAITIDLDLPLTFKDRLLILLGGRVTVRAWVKTDHPAKLATTRYTWSVLERGSKFG